jgi:hypothetical protein
MNKLAYTLALLIASNWAYAAPAEKILDPELTVALTEKAEAPAEKAADAKVRKPTGDVEKFWGNLGWDDLSDDEKKLWAALGWNGKLWAAGAAAASAPASQNTVWDKLTKEEQAAATALGYDKKSWNQE